MRRDLYVGMMASVLLNGGLALFNGHPAPTPAAQKRMDAIEAFILPLIPPEESPPADPETAEHRSEVATPSLPDPLSPPALDAFTQPVQAPDPAPPDAVMVRIPVDFVPGSRPHERVFDPSSLDQLPNPTARSAPVYPFQLKRVGVEGTVVVDFVVDANGAVERAYAVSSTNPGFEAAAVQGVGKWKFRPGRKNGRAVSTHMQVPIVFSLNRTD